MTVTTVGYGDKYPVTNSGRFVGILLMTIGVGLFGVLTGYLANAFLKPPAEIQREQQEGSSTPGDLQSRLEEIRRILQEQEKYTAELRKNLDAISVLVLEKAE